MILRKVNIRSVRFRSRSGLSGRVLLTVFGMGDKFRLQGQSIPR